MYQASRKTDFTVDPISKAHPNDRLVLCIVISPYSITLHMTIKLSKQVRNLTQEYLESGSSILIV